MMNPVARLFEQFSPSFFSYLCRLKKDGMTDIPPFIFHGPTHSGKEWTAIKALQLLNCAHFLDPDHHPFSCSTCTRINTFQPGEGLLIFLSALPLEYTQPVLLEKITTIHTQTDLLVREDLTREISKIELLLESQLLKEKEGGNKKLGFPKAQALGEQIHALRHALIQGNISSGQLKDFSTLLSEIQNFNVDMGLDFLRFLLKKLQLSSIHSSSYRILLLKDPALLKNQELILNTILKTMEDPKARFTTFILTHRKNHLLKTIRSRSHFLSFAPLSSSFQDYLQKEFPHYTPLFSPSLTPPIPPALSEISKAPTFKQKSLILDYLEGKKASYIGLSPLLRKKREEIQNLITGIREYNLTLKNVLEVLPYL